MEQINRVAWEQARRKPEKTHSKHLPWKEQIKRKTVDHIYMCRWKRLCQIFRTVFRTWMSKMNGEFVDDHDFETRSCSFFRYYFCSLLLRPNNPNVLVLFTNISWQFHGSWSCSASFLHVYNRQLTQHSMHQRLIHSLHLLYFLKGLRNCSLQSYCSSPLLEIRKRCKLAWEIGISYD